MAWLAGLAGILRADLPQDSSSRRRAVEPSVALATQHYQLVAGVASVVRQGLAA